MAKPTMGFEHGRLNQVLVGTERSAKIGAISSELGDCVYGMPGE